MLTYKIIGNEKLKTKSFSKLVKFLKMSYEDGNLPKITIILNSNEFEFSLNLPDTLEKAIPYIMEESIKIASFHNIYVTISDMKITKSRNIWEAIIVKHEDDDVNQIIDTESLEWPMKLSPDMFYVYCLFRYLTGVNTIIGPAFD